MNNVELQTEITRITRAIAYAIFKGNQSKSWDKLAAELYRKYNINVNQRKAEIKASKNNKGRITLFDILNNSELQLTYQTCLELYKMYGKVLERIA